MKSDDFRCFRRVMNGKGSRAGLRAMMLGYTESIIWVPSLQNLRCEDDLSVTRLRIGVADGVGAWNTKEKGRPGLWARLLMHYWALECEERMKLWKVDRATSVAVTLDEEEVDVVQMLQRAYLRTAIEMERTGGWVGSTTACVALLQRSTLHIANVPSPFPELWDSPYKTCTDCLIARRFKGVHCTGRRFHFYHRGTTTLVRLSIPAWHEFHGYSD